MIRLQRNRKHLQASRTQQQDAYGPITEDDVINVDQNPNVVCGISSISFRCGLCKWIKCSTIANRFRVKLDTILEQFHNEETKTLYKRLWSMKVLRHFCLGTLLLTRDQKRPYKLYVACRRHMSP